jgi:hypothetical protein
VNTHTHPAGVEIVYEVPLLPIITAGVTFLRNGGGVRSCDSIVITGAPAWRGLGECVTLDKTF